MTFLLDTHTLLWAVFFDSMLSAQVRSLVEDRENRLFVSAASAFEIATKVRIGRLPEALELELRFEEILSRLFIEVSPISGAIALRAGRFTQGHRDPFDRMICATALTENVALLSKDAALDAFGVQRIW